MSTIELIITSLQATAKDKTKSLDESYFTHSKWLQDELALISRLIQQDPRAAVNKEIPLITAPDNQTKKRKSPEIAFVGPKLSPDQKRTSLDVVELFVGAGLPSDFSKLKKQQIVVELEKRGNTSFSMKCTKDVLIEALKDCLMAEKRAASTVNPEDNIIPTVTSQETCITENSSIEIICQTEETKIIQELPLNSASMQPTQSSEIEEMEIHEVPQNLQTASPLKTPGRKGSLMQDIRSMVANSSQNCVSESVCVESEFKQRYRLSQLRKSQCLDQPPLNVASELIVNEQAQTIENIPSLVCAIESATTTQSAETVVEESVDDHSDSEHEKSAEGESTWMEVSSPGKSSTSSEKDDCGSSSLNETIESCASASDFNSTSESTKSNDSNSSLSKKLNNLQVGQTSLTDKIASKTTIMALEKAKQAKAAEEMKALTKKREQEQKSTSMNKLAKKILSPFKPKPSNVLKPANETNQKDNRKGFMSNIFNKNQKGDPKPNTPVFDVSVVTVATESNSNRNLAPSENCGKAELKTISCPTEVQKPTVSAVLENYIKAVNECYDEPPKPSEVEVNKVVGEELALTNEQEKTVIKSSSIETELSSVPNESNSATSKSPVEVAQILKQIASDVTIESQSTNDDNIQENLEEYPMEDRGSSDDEGSGTDDEESNKKKQERIPEWAQGPKLKEALERQFGLNGHTPMDPDQIFPEVQTCSLEEIFGKREGLTRKYANRSSSAHWEPDQLTLVEKRQYRTHMGYGGKSNQVQVPMKIH